MLLASSIFAFYAMDLSEVCHSMQNISSLWSFEIDRYLNIMCKFVPKSLSVCV